MKLNKTVTRAKIEANRMNSKRSTGPRTQRGKQTAKYNALTLGLFATHVVIPVCDGDDSDAEFQALISGLHQQFQPEGTFEECFVLKIAGCMWRLRRATRCEYGSVRQSAASADHVDYPKVIADLERQIVRLVRQGRWPESGDMIVAQQIFTYHVLTGHSSGLRAGRGAQPHF